VTKILAYRSKSGTSNEAFGWIKDDHRPRRIYQAFCFDTALSPTVIVETIKPLLSGVSTVDASGVGDVCLAKP
jgi:hypothetical protein